MFGLDKAFEWVFAFVVIAVACVMPFASKSIFGNEPAVLIALVAGCPAAIRERFAAALERRQRQERFRRIALTAQAVFGVALGACGILGVVNLPLLAALFCALLSCTGAYQLLQVVYVRSGRRIAALTRRRLTGLVPPWCLAVPAVGWACTLYIGAASGNAAAAAIVLLSSICAVGLCFAAASSPAIVGTDDPAADEALDRVVRTERIGQLLFVASAGPCILASTIFDSHVAAAGLIRLLCFASYGGTLLLQLRWRKRVPATVSALLV